MSLTGALRYDSLVEALKVIIVTAKFDPFCISVFIKADDLTLKTSPGYLHRYVPT